MKKMWLRYLLAFLFMAGALYFAFRNQDFDLLLFELGKARILFIVAGVAIMIFSHYVRAWRWRVFLKPMEVPVSAKVGFEAIMAAYGINNVIPRSGEIVRPLYYARKMEAPLSGTVASIAIERISDLIAMIIFTAISLLLFRTQLAVAFPALADGTDLILVVMGIVLILAFVIMFSEKLTVRLINFFGKMLPAKMSGKIERGTKALAIGLRGIRSSAPISFFIGTLFIWFLYALSMYVSLFAFPIPTARVVGLLGCVLLSTLSGLAFIVPTPGGTGSYHFFISQALIAIFFVPRDISMAYATLTHAANYIFTTVTGLIFLFRQGISIKEVRSTQKERYQQKADAKKMAKVAVVEGK